MRESGKDLHGVALQKPKDGSGSSDGGGDGGGGGGGAGTAIGGTLGALALISVAVLVLKRKGVLRGTRAGSTGGWTRQKSGAGSTRESMKPFTPSPGSGDGDAADNATVAKMAGDDDDAIQMQVI